MRRLVLICLITGVFLAACGSKQPTPTTSNSNANSNGSSLAASLSDYIASDPALVRNTGRPQVVEFFAFWCTTCQAMRPRIHELEDHYSQQVDFIYLDIDAENTKDLRQQLNFTGQRPTIVFLSADGVEVSRTIGEQSKDALTEQIETLLTAG